MSGRTAGVYVNDDLAQRLRRPSVAGQVRARGREVDRLVEKLRRRDDLSREEEAALRDVLGETQVAAAGTDIIREGDRPQYSTLLVEGFTARYVTLGDGGRQITELNVSGDFIDLHSFVMKHMDHGVMALTDCVIQPAPHVALRRLTENHPHLSRLLWLDTVIDAAIHTSVYRLHGSAQRPGPHGASAVRTVHEAGRCRRRAGSGVRSSPVAVCPCRCSRPFDCACEPADLGTSHPAAA